MSMYRQLWLAIITSMLLALGGSLLASLLGARSYLEAQLTQKNIDNATSLALALSQTEPDAVSVELAVSALFDSGHYESIRVDDPQGRLLVERQAEGIGSQAPDWFVHSLPLRAAPGIAQINDGWQQFGTITLISHSRFAYGALWRAALEISAALVVACLVGGCLGSLILLRLKGPLAAVVQQARAIAERRFSTIAEPDVPELRQLAGAMNGMVMRVKSMFDEEAARLEAVRREANFDPLTGLAERAHFLAHLHEAALQTDSAGGTLFLIRVARLTELNRRLGRETTDNLLRRIGESLRELAVARPNTIGGRLNGADFALLMPADTSLPIVGDALRQQLTGATAAFCISPEQPVTLPIAGGRFVNGVEPASVLAQVDAALAASESEGGNAPRLIDIQPEDSAPQTARDWSEHLQRAFDQKWVRLASFPVVWRDGTRMHDECPLRLKLDIDGDWLPAHRFVPQAERLQLTARMDLAAVTLGLEMLKTRPESADLAINLSAHSLNTPSFQRELLSLLTTHPAATRRLWLEIAETGVLAHFDAFHSLCREIKQLGGRIGIEHFGHRFSEIGRYYDLGIDYLKVDSTFVRDLNARPGNQVFLKGLVTIAHSIGITVVAEGVVNEQELAALMDAGFDAATGPHIRG